MIKISGYLTPFGQDPPTARAKQSSVSSLCSYFAVTLEYLPLSILSSCRIPSAF